MIADPNLKNVIEHPIVAVFAIILCCVPAFIHTV